jgi:peptidoglycan/LPS O-acetylase OafA/YrhL
MNSMSAKPESKWTEIDGLRALAVSGVMLLHWGPAWVGRLHLGDGGVRLFFVISGFLITGILLRARARIESGGAGFGDEMKTFYVRRTLRIFPPYYAVLFIVLGLVLAGYMTAPSLGAHFAYLSNFWAYRHSLPKVGGHFWSLAVEEQFYLIWPALILLTPRKAMLPLILAVIVTGPAFRLLVPAGGVLLPANLDLLGIGALLALATQRGRPLVSAEIIVSGALGVLILAGGLMLGGPFARAGFNLGVGVASFAILGAIVSIPHPRGLQWLNWSPLQYLGRISYGVYLYHPFVAWGVDAATGDRLAQWPRIAACFAATVVVATLSWRFFEQPILRLKDRFQYDRARPNQIPAQSEAAA